MCSSWKALTKVGALKLQDSTLNQANIVSELVENQQQLAKNLRDDISTQLRNTVTEAMLMFEQQDDQSDSINVISTHNSINSTTSTLTLETLMPAIQGLKKEITSLKSNKSNNTTNRDINPRTGKPFKRYCWTHGCCTHHGCDCQDK